MKCVVKADGLESGSKGVDETTLFTGLRLLTGKGRTPFLATMLEVTFGVIGKRRLKDIGSQQ